MRKTRPILISLLIWISVLAAVPIVEHSHEWIPEVNWYAVLDSTYCGEPNGYSLDIAEIDTAVLIVEEPVAPIVAAEEYPIAEAMGLDAFFESLEEADTSAIRVAHYGDSQIEEDRITSTIRQHLQDQYGGDGLGLIPLHQTIPTRTLKQRLYLSDVLQTTTDGPVRYLAYGPRRMRQESKEYGPMGQVAIMDNELVEGSEDARLELTLLKPKNYNRFFRHSQIRLLADSSIRMEQTSDGVHLLGRGRVYGLSLQTPTGVHVDNIPMRGCSGMVFSGIDSEQLRQYFHDYNVRLIILQFGGNFIAGTHTEQGIRNAVVGLTQQIHLLKRLAPGVSILFVGPSDMLRRIQGKLESDPMVPLMDELLAKMADREHIAYYSLYRAMGGEGSMAAWQDKGWAASDGVHFSQRGADVAGEDLWLWMEREHRRYLQHTQNP